MTILTASMNNHSTAGLVGQPAHRRFLSDMTDPRGVIPKAMLRYPELATLEKQRQRLVAALEEARRPSGPPSMSDAQYVDARAKALRDGTEMPSPPPTHAATDAYRQRQANDAKAAEQALLALADEICEALRAHPEWEQEGRAHVATLRAEGQARIEAIEREVARQVEPARVVLMWLERAARDELFVVTTTS